jgi:Protein of unknown function (DUF3306)
MSADESFLVRWSRRKRAEAANKSGHPKPENAGDEGAAKPAAAPPPPRETRSLVDPGSLPPIETIGPGSDIRPFLAAGVPADLTRAALRRAWSADPTIRDFIGLSENSWDFNAVGGVPGFGSLAIEDARRHLAQVIEETKALGPDCPATEPSSHDQTPAPVSECQTTTHSAADQIKSSPDTTAGHRTPPRRGEGDSAVQHEKEDGEPRGPLARRRHCGALPD